MEFSVVEYSTWSVTWMVAKCALQRFDQVAGCFDRRWIFW